VCDPISMCFLNLKIGVQMKIVKNYLSKPPLTATDLVNAGKRKPSKMSVADKRQWGWEGMLCGVEGSKGEEWVSPIGAIPYLLLRP